MFFPLSNNSLLSQSRAYGPFRAISVFINLFCLNGPLGKNLNVRALFFWKLLSYPYCLSFLFFFLYYESLICANDMVKLVNYKKECEPR